MSKNDASFLWFIGLVIISIALGMRMGAFIGWIFFGAVLMLGGIGGYLLNYLNSNETPEE